MRIEHIAIWAEDIELLRAFYMQYFNMLCGEKYSNPSRNFTSYFLHFREGGARIELMHKPDMDTPANISDLKGLTHFSISVGSREAVDALTGRLKEDGYTVLSGPRTTGDGYYESSVADPEGNLVEITE